MGNLLLPPLPLRVLSLPLLPSQNGKYNLKKKECISYGESSTHTHTHTRTLRNVEYVHYLDHSDSSDGITDVCICPHPSH